MLRQQLTSYYDRIPVSILGNSFNAAVVFAFFDDRGQPPWLGWWAVLLVVMATGRGWLLLRCRRGRPISDDPERVRQWAIAAAVAFGAAWAAAIATLMATGTPSQVALLGIIAAGMMSGGAFIYATLPIAAYAYVGTIMLGTAVGFVRMESPITPALVALLASYALVVHRSVQSSFADYRGRLSRERDLEDAAQTVKLLLNDYQEQGSDWLWEVDAAGRLGVVTARFAEAAGRPAGQLAGTTMTTLFARCPETEILRDHLRQGRSFRDLTLPLTVSGEERWWTLSARPVPLPDQPGAWHLRGVATDVTAARKAEAKVSYMAHYDGLTDLPNRFLFRETLHRALNRCAPDQLVAVLYLDLDHFKSINDTLGHPIGDQLLQTVARRLESCLREHDHVARLGGDEFAILLTGLRAREDVMPTAARIIARLGEPVDLGEHQVMTATSIGIALAPDDGTAVEDLLKHADLALYSAKADGRSRYAFFVADMNESAQRRRQIEMDLRAALGRDELSLHYQPLINIGTGATAAYEALMRWRHPTRGTIMPADFIAIAEETGLIIQLGEWVIRRAVRDVKEWPEHLSVSVNLSPAQMRSGGLVKVVAETLAEHGVAPTRLELEITETVLMQESESNLKILHQLRALGVRIALDDFGTGYSSLNYLRSFPFDKIKIDRCFVRDVDASEGSQAIIRAITGLASSLGMTTTAEGVERAEQLEQLRREGCVEVQGFLFSKAVGVEQLPGLDGHTGPHPAAGTAAERGLAPTEPADA